MAKNSTIKNISTGPGRPRKEPPPLTLEIWLENEGFMVDRGEMRSLSEEEKTRLWNLVQEKINSDDTHPRELRVLRPLLIYPRDGLPQGIDIVRAPELSSGRAMSKIDQKLWGTGFGVKRIKTKSKKSKRKTKTKSKTKSKKPKRKTANKRKPENKRKTKTRR